VKNYLVKILPINNFVLSICICFTLNATYLQANELFDTAVTAARSGNYVLARELFLQVNDPDIDYAYLQYNLGVANYKLGYYPSSKQAFSSLTSHPLFSAQANYNLGLISLKMNDFSAAQQFFLLCQLKTDNPKLKTLSKRMSLKSQTLLKQSSKHKPINSIVLRSNNYQESSVNSLSIHSDITYLTHPVLNKDFYTIQEQKQADNVSFLNFHYLRDYSKHLTLELSASKLNYFKQTQHNYQQLNSKLSLQGKFGHWKLLLGLQNEVFYSGLLKQINENGIYFSAKARPIGSLILEILSNYQLTQSQAETSAAFDGRSFSNQIQFHFGNQFRHSYFIFEQNINRRQGIKNSFNQQTISYSPTRYSASFIFKQQFLSKFTIFFRANFNFSIFAGLDQLNNGHFVNRRDYSSRYSTELNYQLSKKSLAMLELHRSQNQSVIHRYHFESNGLTFGVKYFFF